MPRAAAGMAAAAGVAPAIPTPRMRRLGETSPVGARRRRHAARQWRATVVEDLAHAQPGAAGGPGRLDLHAGHELADEPQPPAVGRLQRRFRGDGLDWVEADAVVLHLEDQLVAAELGAQRV